jgi:hypothetical protein
MSTPAVAQTSVSAAAPARWVRRDRIRLACFVLAACVGVGMRPHQSSSM